MVPLPDLKFLQRSRQRSMLLKTFWGRSVLREVNEMNFMVLPFILLFNLFGI
jgi:hypothetical protein